MNISRETWPTLASEFRAEIARKGLKQIEICYQVGISQGQLSKILRGHEVPTRGLLERLRLAIGFYGKG